MPQAFIASIVSETNSFSPLPTGWAAFEENDIRTDASRSDEGMAAAGLSVFRRMAEVDGYTVAESISAFAQPAGRVLRPVYTQLRDRLLDDLRKTGQVDLVLLLLHGAMMAEGEDDCEADLLERVRSVAPRSVIGTTIDPHCHLSERMVAAADIITIFKEYPHTDVGDCAAQLYRLCQAKATGAIAPVPALVDTRMVGLYPTFEEPMRAIVESLRARERSGAVRSASLAHGFPWGDSPDMGTRVLTYGDNYCTALAEARAVAAELYAARAALQPQFPDIAASLDRAAACDGICVIGDHSDNPGGGAPGDNMAFLRGMLARNLNRAVFGGIYDPMAARLCGEAGEGARLPLRLGGKLGEASGDPLDLMVEVVGVRRDHDQDAFGTRDRLGLSVLLRSGGIELLVTSLRSQIYGRDAFEAFGIDLAQRTLIVVKSSRHFEQGFAGLADHLWTASGPGALSLDFGTIPYTRRARDFYPIRPDPWEGGGPRVIDIHAR